MKSITLFKKTPNIQLGHLYEHIFCDVITKYLFDKGVFASIDYILDAKTYHGGIIVIELACYTAQAMQHIDKIKSLKPAMSEEILNTAWDQLESEKQMLFGHSGSEMILKGLRELDEKQWSTFDELDVIDVNDLRRQNNPFYISNDKLKRTKQLTIEFYLENNALNREILPLANRIIEAIGANLQYLLTRELGIYCNDELSRYTKPKLSYQLKFSTFPDFKMNENELRESIHHTVSELKKHDGFERLCIDLASIPNYREYWMGPSIQRVYESSYQAVGAVGWKRIATKHNIDTILEHLHAKVKFGEKFVEL